MASTDNQPQVQVSSSDGCSLDSDKTISDSFRKTTYEDLVLDRNLFQEELCQFLELSEKQLSKRNPTVGGTRLDLHQLFVRVTARGGLERVIKERKCAEVINTLDVKSPVTNASVVLKGCYLKFLFKFEHVYYLKKPISSFAAREEEISGVPGPRAGTAVHGIIDGKFDNGYLVSVKIGSTVLKGVVFDNSDEPQGREKIKRKSTTHPKKPRTGYVFYYLENYQRLKPRYNGTVQLLTQEIGKMWKNLSEADKEVYLQQGARDVERYKREILEYRALMASSAAENVAATDAAVTTEAVATSLPVNEAMDSDATECDVAMYDAEETDAETACEEAE